MSIRFSDHILDNIKGSGFVIRTRVPISLKVFIGLLLFFDIACSLAYTLEDTAISAIFSGVVIASIFIFGGLIWFFMTRFRTLLMATEFQAALLASATQIGTRFCFITNAQGTISYVDAGFQKIFVNFLNNGSYTVSDLFAFTDISEDVQKQVFQALKQNKPEQVVLSFHDSAGNKLNMMIAVDSIPRPRGYFIVRGRDYVEKRSEDMENNGDQNTQILLQKTITHLDTKMLVADSTGKIVAINNDLEQWLGYGEGEILQAKMLLGHIIHQYVKHEIGILLLRDFDGQVMVRLKNHTSVTVKIHQKLCTDNRRTYGISVVFDVQQGI